MTAHAMLSASSSKRWLMCTPSARLEATLPEPKRSPKAFDFSGEGTLAHSLAEIKLRLQYEQIDMGEYKRELDIIQMHPIYANKSKQEKEDFNEAVENYVVYVRSQIGEGDVPLFEQRVDFSEYVPDGFGTADVIILSHHRIKVIDLKFGKGIAVSATDNTQLRLYALGAYCKFKNEYPEIRDVQYTIVQPRLSNGISSDGTTVAKLVDWARYYVKPKAQKAWSGAGEFLPGDWCTFCRAKATCRARSDFNTEIAKLEFKEPPLLQESEITLVLDRASMLRSWASDVEEYALERALDDGLLPEGYKLGTTKTARKIEDQDSAAKILVDNGFEEEDIFEPRSLKSVAKLEKLASKGKVVGLLEDLIVRPEGSPKLTKAGTAKEDFS